MEHKFSHFTLDTEHRSLKQGSKEVPISPKMYAMLAYFVENQGQIITKQQLLEAVWKDRIISDTTFYKLIERLRSVLGENDDKQLFIKTIHGEGYQFLISKDVTAQDGSSYSNKVLGIIFLAAVFIGIYIIWVNNSKPDEIYDIDIQFRNLNDSSVLGQGVQLGLKDYLLSHFSEYKKQAVPDVKNKKTLVVIQVLEKVNNQYKLIVEFKIDEVTLSLNEFTGGDVENILTQYFHWLNEISVFKSLVSQELLVNEFTPSNQAMSQWIQGIGFWQLQQYNQALNHFNHALKLDENFLWAKLYHAVVNRILTNKESAIAALELLAQSNTSDHYNLTLNRILGFTYISLFQLDNAKEHFYLAEQLAINSKDKENLFKVNNGLGYLNVFIGSYSLASKYLSQAVELASEQKNAILLTRAKSSQCLLLYYQARINEALEVCLSTVKNLEEQKNYSSMARIEALISSLYLDQSDLAQAKFYANLSLDNYIKYSNLERASHAYFVLFQVAMFEEQFEMARSYLDQLESSIHENNYNTLIHQLYKAQAMMAIHDGNLQLAQRFIDKNLAEAEIRQNYFEQNSSLCMNMLINDLQGKTDLVQTYYNELKANQKSADDLRLNLCLAKASVSSLENKQQENLLQSAQENGLSKSNQLSTIIHMNY